MDICISSGHGSRISGAVGIINEVHEARKVTDRVAELLRTAKVGVKVFHDNTSTSVSANLSAITAFHNAQKRDRDVSVHFNAFAPTTAPRGTEVLYVSAQALATQASRAMALAGGFINRGAKRRTDLGFLNRTQRPAILLEVCFVDSVADVALYRERFEAICRGIAESISGAKIPGEPPSVVPPAPEPPWPEQPSGDQVVDITIETKGTPIVTINGDPITVVPSGRIAGGVTMTLAWEGDVIVNVNGEDFQIEKPPVRPPRPTLRRGSEGPDVRLIQQALNIKIDCIFGPATEAAVRQFQREQGLVTDGVVGPRTWEALERVHPWSNEA